MCLIEQRVARPSSHQERQCLHWALDEGCIGRGVQEEGLAAGYKLDTYKGKSNTGAGLSPVFYTLFEKHTRLMLALKDL